MKLGPIEIMIQIPKSEQKISESKLLDGIKNGTYAFGPYESYAPCIGPGVCLVKPSDLFQFPKNVRHAIGLEIGEIFNLIVENKPDTIKKLKEILNKKIYLKFYCFDVLKTSKYSVQQKKLIFEGLTQAGGYHFLWHYLPISELNTLLAIYGDRLTNAVFTDGANALIHTALNRFPGDALQRAIILINHGIDVNYQHPYFGTALHCLIANELDISPWIKIFKNKIKFTIRDKEGKTPLLLACKTRQYSTVFALLSLTKEGIDVGINTPDNEGRTPLMISGALGDYRSFDLLIKMRANLAARDKQGRNVAWYVHASSQTITHILNQIHIEPSRHFKAPHNWVYCNPGSTPLTCSASTHPQQMVLISHLPAHKNLIEAILNHTHKHDPNLHAQIYKQVACLFNSEPKTIHELCIDGQILVRERFESLFKTQNLLRPLMDFESHSYTPSSIFVDSQYSNGKTFHSMTQHAEISQSVLPPEKVLLFNINSMKPKTILPTEEYLQMPELIESLSRMKIS